MVTCTSCGSNVTGKRFCPNCGTPVQSVTNQVTAIESQICPHCQGEIQAGAAFCMHCGASLKAQTPPPPPALRTCPACHSQVSGATAFCTNCGHDMNAPMAQAAGILCRNCGRQNAPGLRFCGGCGQPLVVGAPTPHYTNIPTPQYPQQSQQQQPLYGQSYQQPQQYMQGGYQAQPMVLRCPTCMAMAPLGSSNCVSCRTNLAGIVPTPAATPMQGQGGMGGFLQGDAGKMAIGALGGAAAIIGGEMLMHGIENQVEDRVEGDMGFGERRHHHHRHHDGGLLGPLGELVDDIGL